MGMTEEDLIELGFDQVHITNAESDNGYDYYYYQKELCSGVVLHSTDSLDVENNEWTIKSFDIPAIEIKSKFHYTEFLEIMGNITC